MYRKMTAVDMKEYKRKQAVKEKKQVLQNFDRAEAEKKVECLNQQS